MWVYLQREICITCSQQLQVGSTSTSAGDEAAECGGQASPQGRESLSHTTTWMRQMLKDASCTACLQQSSPEKPTKTPKCKAGSANKSTRDHLCGCRKGTQQNPTPLHVKCPNNMGLEGSTSPQGTQRRPACSTPTGKGQTAPRDRRPHPWGSGGNAGKEGKKGIPLKGVDKPPSCADLTMYICIPGSLQTTTRSF